MYLGLACGPVRAVHISTCRTRLSRGYRCVCVHVGVCECIHQLFSKHLYMYIHVFIAIIISRVNYENERGGDRGGKGETKTV